MYSANGNFYKNSHIIENMENDVAKGDDNVNPFSTKDVQGVNPFSIKDVQGVNPFSIKVVQGVNPFNNSSIANVVSSGIRNPRVAANFAYGPPPSGPPPSGPPPSGNQNPSRILITELAADSKNIHLNEYKYLMFNELDNNINLFNNNTKPFIKKIIEINIYFNIYNNTKSPTNSTFTVNTNKQVTFEYNYNNNNKYLNNFTKITLGNDDLTKYATDHTFTIDIKPKSTIRCKLTIMPNTNEIYSETITYEPEIIIKNLKTAISNAGKLV